MRTVKFILFSTLLAGCATAPAPGQGEAEDNLRDFAMANCLLQYFEKKNWDVTDIRGVTGGYVEMGHSPVETYSQIAETVQAWAPDIRTKHNLDTDLVKCFHLVENTSLEAVISEASHD
jgi:hypothetical protein